MKEQIANAALEFLKRVDLKGSEAEAMVAVKQAIVNSVDKEPEVSELVDPNNNASES